MTLEIPIAYGTEENTSIGNEGFKSYEVKSIPVLSGKKPAQLSFPNNCIRFKKKKSGFTFKDCDQWNRSFYSCDVNSVDHQMNSCLNEMENLKSEFVARRVSKISFCHKNKNLNLGMPN